MYKSTNNCGELRLTDLNNTIVLNGKNLPITLFLNPYMNNKDMKDNKNPFNIDSAISFGNSKSLIYNKP